MVFECGRGVVDGCRVEIRLPDCEAQLWQMRDLIGLAARRLEQDGCADSPMDVPQRPLGIGVERPAVRMLAGDIRIDRRHEAWLTELAKHYSSEARLRERR